MHFFVRCIQVDSLNPLGFNHDLVSAARVDALKAGDTFRMIQGYAFEHWAKERCIIPASAFSNYKALTSVDTRVVTEWYPLDRALEAIGMKTLDEIEKEVHKKSKRAPVAYSDLTDRGTCIFPNTKLKRSIVSLGLDTLNVLCRSLIVGRGININ